MTNKTIALIGLGGTISMTDAPGGLTPTRSINDLLSGAGVMPEGLTLRPLDLMRKPSASLTPEDIHLLAATIDRLAAEGADGIVVTQGTDTLEEVAFAIELLSSGSIPVVFTGAMRGASAAGYDGGANLADAIRVAAHATGRNEVYVVMNGEAHAARLVTKTHTGSVAAFASPDFGPLMRIQEARILEHARLKIPRAPRIELASMPTWPRVALIQLGLTDDCALLPELNALGYAGCVIAATGGGHAPDFAVANIEKTAREMPVILCSRATGGRVFENTYGYPGAETDLLRRGVIASGLSATKARMLLLLCLAQADDAAPDVFRRISTALA